MKSRPKRSHSISSAYSDKSEFQGYSSEGSSAMGSTRSRGPSRDDSASNDGSVGPVARHPADIKSARGLTHAVQTTIAKLKKKGGCPITSIKQDIKENYGFALTSSTNTRRLNAVLKKLQKQGKIVKTTRGFKLVPINEARRRRRQQHHRKGRRRRRHRRRKGRGRRRRRRRRGKKSRGRRRGRKHRRRRRRRRRRRGRSQRHRRGRGKSHHRKGRRRHRRRQKRRRRSRGRKHAIGPKGQRANLGTSGGGSPGPLIGGPSRGGQGGYVPRGGSPRILSRNASRLPSRAASRLPSRLPSRSHSPGRPGFDPRETPPTHSYCGSARASARNSPGPHLMASLDDYDL